MKIALVIPRNAVEGEKSFYDYSFYQKFLFSKRYFSYLLAIRLTGDVIVNESFVQSFLESYYRGLCKAVGEI